MKKIILSVVLAFFTLGCTSTQTEDVYPLSENDGLAIPIILSEEDVMDNRELIIKTIKDRIAKNSIYSVHEGEIRIKVDVTLSSSDYMVNSVEIKYIDTISDEYISNVFPVTTMQTNDGRFIRVLVGKTNKSNEVLQYYTSFDAEEPLEIEIEDLLEEELDVDSDYMDNSLTPREMYAIQKDIQNIHNKYVPLRLMRNRCLDWQEGECEHVQ